MSINIINNILSETDINYILSLPEVINAKQQIDLKKNGFIYFSISLTPSLKNSIFEKFGLTLDSIPMRWIKGNTHPHIDVSSTNFENTYLAYLTDSYGEFLIENKSYPITKGTAFIFNEGLKHETINTGLEPRLLLGPMSEQGLAVGGSGNFPGGTIVYIRQLTPTDPIQYSTNLIHWTTIGFNFNISNDTPLNGFVKIYFISNITLNNTSDYFGILSEKIQFGNETLNENGIRPTITITATNYEGLFFNGIAGPDPEDNGKNNIRIYNLNINGTGTLAEGAGWFGRSYFGKGSSDNYIINCSSSGNISSDYCGGIVGRYAGSGTGANLTLIGCSIYGNISGDQAGGIVGADAGNVTIESCWTEITPLPPTIIIGNGAGGIVGANCQTATITNCYSPYDIRGDNAGGIIGANAGYGSVIISNCYSTGVISGPSSGGICGSLGVGTFNVTITNCYSIGSIESADFAGGICGLNLSGSVVTISNCYTVGTAPTGIGYIIGGVSVVNGSGSVYLLVQNYSEAANSSSGWNVNNAQNTLTGVPAYPPITWISIGSSLPYELFNMGYTPYSTTNIVGNNLSRNSSLSVVAGGSTIPGPLRPSSYFILYSDLGTATINGDDGKISVPSSTAPGTYTLWIYYFGSYNVATITLTVTDAPTPTPPVINHPYIPIQRVSFNQKSGFCGTKPVSSIAVGIGAIRGKGSSTRIFNNCKGNNTTNFNPCQLRIFGINK